jgi:hypothetical protein
MMKLHWLARAPQLFQPLALPVPEVLYRIAADAELDEVDRHFSMPSEPVIMRPSYRGRFACPTVGVLVSTRKIAKR